MSRTSITRKMKRGRLKLVFFKTLDKYIFYRRTSKGRWIKTDPYNNIDIGQGPGLHNETIRRMESVN